MSGEETLPHVFIGRKIAYLSFGTTSTSGMGFRTTPEWRQLKFVLCDHNSNEPTAVVLLLLGLHALWRCRMVAVNCAKKSRAPWEIFSGFVRWPASVQEQRSPHDNEHWSAVLSTVTAEDIHENRPLSTSSLSFWPRSSRTICSVNPRAFCFSAFKAC